MKVRKLFLIVVLVVLLAGCMPAVSAPAPAPAPSPTPEVYTEPDLNGSERKYKCLTEWAGPWWEFSGEVLDIIIWEFESGYPSSETLYELWGFVNDPPVEVPICVFVAHEYLEDVVYYAYKGVIEDSTYYLDLATDAQNSFNSKTIEYLEFLQSYD